MQRGACIFLAVLTFANVGISWITVRGYGQILHNPFAVSTTKLQLVETEEQLIERLNVEIMANTGVQLDQLINPGKIVNLERDIAQLEIQLSNLTTEKDKLVVQNKIKAQSDTLAVEKRLVMRGWLKNLFVGQSIIAGIVSLAMAYDAVPGYPVPLPLRVLGFWMWWLFIIPSLRARKPQAAEKEALNIAFLASPVVSLLAPALLTRDTAVLWWLNAAVVALCYLYAYTTQFTANNDGTLMLGTTSGDNEKAVSAVAGDGAGNSNTGGSDTLLPPWLRGVLRALDYGSGQERGVRK